MEFLHTYGVKVNSADAQGRPLCRLHKPSPTLLNIWVLSGAIFRVWGSETESSIVRHAGLRSTWQPPMTMWMAFAVFLSGVELPAGLLYTCR